MAATYAVVTWIDDNEPEVEVRISMADRVAAADKWGADIQSPKTAAYATWLALKRTGYDKPFQEFLEASDAFIAEGEGPGN